MKYPSTRRILLLPVVAACGFHGGGAPATDDAAAELPDAPVVIDARPPAVCDPADPTLVACYAFDGDTRDRSSHALDATASNVAFVPGRLGQAMQFSANSAADVADSPLLDVHAVTMEAWVKPAALPGNGNRAGVIDVNGQYGMFIHAGGTLACSFSSGVALPDTPALLAVDRWSHVACTYDGSTGIIYVDGAVASMASNGGAMATSGTTGASLAADNPPGAGSRLSGLIDETRIYSAARTALQICGDAERSACP